MQSSIETEWKFHGVVNNSFDLIISSKPSAELLF